MMDTPTVEQIARDLAQLQAELEQAKKLLRLEIEDECQTDTSIRNMIRPILGETKTDHDGYAVVPLDTAVETLIAHFQARLARAETELKELLEAAEFVLQYDGRKIGSIGQGLLRAAIDKAKAKEKA
jgi:ElaB/YqjD/DUF883 family membrane-anchored ribosome-binding protein